MFLQFMGGSAEAFIELQGNIQDSGLGGVAKSHLQGGLGVSRPDGGSWLRACIGEADGAVEPAAFP